MAGLSNYPRQIDTTTELYDVNDQSVLVPNMLNSHRDAILSLEATVGFPDDGAGSGLESGLETSLADWVAFPTTRSLNRKYPWDSIDSRSIYGSNDQSLAQWTLGVGVTADWTSFPGLLRLDYPTTQNFLIASVTLPAEALMWVQFAVGVLGTADPGLDIGFSIAGTGADLDGWGCYQSNYGAVNGRHVENGVRSGTGGVALCTVFSTIGVLRWDGSNVDNFIFPWKMPFSAVHSTNVSRGTPTKFCLYTRNITPAFGTVYIEFIAFGWTAHPFLAS